MSEDASIIPIERVEQSIYLIRGHKVMLDRDLAGLYGVETRVLNQAVKRNAERFPADFMLELTREEIRNISQFVISSDQSALLSVIIKSPGNRSIFLRTCCFKALVSTP